MQDAIAISKRHTSDAPESLNFGMPSLAMISQTIIRSRSKVSHSHRRHRVRYAKHPRALLIIYNPNIFLLFSASVSSPSFLIGSVLITLAGFPTTTDRGGTDFVTTLLAPTSASARPDKDNSCLCWLPNAEWNTRFESQSHLSHSPTVEPWPIVTPPSTVTFPPNQTSCSAWVESVVRTHQRRDIRTAVSVPFEKESRRDCNLRRYESHPV